MKRTLARYRNSAFRKFIKKHEKYAPFTFFVGGFIFDSFTLGRIDRLYDLVILCLYMTALTGSLYLFNLADDGKWKNTILSRFELYFPLVIQFFFGGLSSAFVIYFSRSVSMSRTVSFFSILLLLLFANEFLKKRISNKYLQFGIYAFVSFTFFTFIVPVLIKTMNTSVFLLSCFISLLCTLAFIRFIYSKSPSTREEISLFKMNAMVLLIYATINLFYLFKLIPPVPLAMQEGMVAHKVTILKDSSNKGSIYAVTYEPDEWYVFWREHKQQFAFKPGEQVYAFTSIFAPTAIDKRVFHRWSWYNSKTNDWEVSDDIGFEIAGGRDQGYRGYSYKSNVRPGHWEVKVMTEEELVLGVLDFELILQDSSKTPQLITREF